MVLVEKSLQNAYIGEYVEEITYTFPGISGTGTIVYNSIAKSGHTVNKIVIQGSCTASGTYAGGYVAMCKDASINNQYEMMSFNLGSGNTSSFSGIRVRQNSSTTVNSYQISSSHLNYTGTNIYEITFTRTGYEFTVNGHYYSGTYDTSSKNVSDAVMDSSTINFYMNTQGGGILSDQIVTVYYNN